MPASCDEVLCGVGSWLEFRAAAEALGRSEAAKKRKGDMFERLVQLLLQHRPEYACQLADVWLYAEIPETVKRRLNLPAKDRGVDLLARTKDGQYWTVQAKYRTDPTGTIPYGELGTFGTLSAAIAQGIARGLICATTREKTADFADARGFDFQQILLDTWEDLPTEFWDQVRRITAGKPPEPLVPREPRDYQQEALTAARRHFMKGGARRGKLIMPCGTGKSLLGYWTAVDVLKARSAVVAVPSLILVRQTLADWAREAAATERPLDVLVVCSDKSTAEGDDHVADLAAPTTTDPGEIRAWLNREPETKDSLRVVFVTYQSGRTLAEAAGRFEFDVGIFDEAHKTAGYEGKAYQHLLAQRNVRIRRRVFMTATERYYEGARDEIVGMNDARIYGERYHYMPFGEAIERGILADYTVLLLAVTRSNAERIRDLIEQRRYVQTELDLAEGTGDENSSVDALDTLTAEDLATAVALRKALTDYGLEHAISFHSRNQYARDFVRVQQALNARRRIFDQLETYRVSSALSAGRRHHELQGFRQAERAVIANARCLTEGVDVPAIDLVLFAQPRQSKVDIVQAVGRALRKPVDQPDKRGYVLVPVLVDDDEDDVEQVVRGTGFENLVAVLRAMSTVDEDVAEHIMVVLGEGPSRGRKRGDVDGDGEAAPARVALVEFAEKLRLRAWDRVEGLRRPRLTEEQILQWADAHRARTGHWPVAASGPVRGAPGETWFRVTEALRLGQRGLRGGLSLVKLLARERGVRNAKELPNLSKSLILKWAKAHKRTTGEWPIVKSGRIQGAAGESWASVDQYLRNGSRGLMGNSSLAKLLSQELGARKVIPKLTESQILKWADSHKRATGAWPNVNSGAVRGASGETWLAIDSSLRAGTRGLRPSSLAKLLWKHRGVRNIGDRPALSEKLILRWADEHKRATGSWPKSTSGPVHGIPGETWRAVALALYVGRRGLTRGTTLAQLLTQRRGVRSHLDRRLSKSQIIRWAKAHHNVTGRWPSESSGPVDGAPMETWNAIAIALRLGTRGLQGGESLARLAPKSIRRASR